jgi:hypothetical protein
LQRHRSQNRPPGMILLRQRCPKQRDEPIAADVRQGPAVLRQYSLSSAETRLHQAMHGLGPQIS